MLSHGFGPSQLSTRNESDVGNSGLPVDSADIRQAEKMLLDASGLSAYQQALHDFSQPFLLHYSSPTAEEIFQATLAFHVSLQKSMRSMVLLKNRRAALSKIQKAS